MLTEQEFSALLNEEDEALLQELGQTLREQSALELPADFARQTAEAIERRFSQLPAWKRLLSALETGLNTPVSSPRVLPCSASLLLGTGLCAFTSHGMACLGLGLLGFCLSWWLLRRAMPGPRSPETWLSFSFYLVPLLAAAGSAVFCGGVIWMLGSLSLSFAGSASHPMFLSWGAGLGVFLYLLSALIPTWRALQRASRGRPLLLSGVQLAHALWLGLLLNAAVLAGWEVTAGQAWALAFAPAGAVVLLLWRRPSCPGEDAELAAALRKSTLSLVLGGLPIAGILVGYYQYHLTRRLAEPQAFQALMRRSEDWVAAQKAVAPTENGWMVVKPAMLRPKHPVITDDLQAGTTVRDFQIGEPVPLEVFQRAKHRFLQQLPLIRQAMQRPHFSVVATQGFSFQSLVPNFLVARSVSYGLSGLALEAQKEGRVADSLDYTLLNLKWSGSFRHGTLLSLMIGTAQLNLALEPVESWLLEGRPDEAQLERLQAALKAATPDPEDFAIAMERELYCADQAFQLLRDDPAALGDELSPRGAMRLLLALVPRSYWLSEQKTYANLQMEGLSGWRELARPEETNLSERVPFSVSTMLLANTHRAQPQFMALLTRFYALRTATALELHRRRHGHYPDRLEELALAEPPVDAIHPNRWQHKPVLQYRRTDQGYLLISESQLYRSAGLKPRQVYGYDGDYQLARLK